MAEKMRLFVFLMGVTVIPLPALMAAAKEPGLPAGYWHQPLAPQGKPPAGWTEVERSLFPQDCGACHAEKLAEWRSSLHSKAFSPGLVGQLLTYSHEDAQACMNCHAPLAEQAEAFASSRREGAASPVEAPVEASVEAMSPEKPGLAAAGNSCGGCHLRDHHRYGPPQRGTGATGWSGAASPHGGVTRTADFERSDFCAPCHQFPQEQAVNGKPLENTVEEWRQSPQARAGRTCQNCHMPDRRHLWRGIHDPEMVASGLTPRVTADREKAVFTLTNSGVGHAFPTYVTPKVVMHALLLDKAGNVLAGSERVSVIGRRVAYDGSDWREDSDTRLLPGQSARLEVAWEGADQARFWLEVRPDDYYVTETYPALLKDLPKNGVPAGLIAQAEAHGKASPYSLFETRLPRPR